MADPITTYDIPMGGASPSSSFGAPEAVGAITAYDVPDMAALTAPRPGAPRGLLEGVWQSMVANYEASTTGLMARGKLPETQMPADPNFAEAAAGAVTGIISDIPAIGVGAAAGFAAASPTVVGAPAGAVIGGFTVPAALRSYLMQSYRTGGINTWGDLWEATKATAHGGAEGAGSGMGAVSGGALALKTVGKLAPSASNAISAAGEAAGMTTAAAAMQMRMPTWQEFQVNALLVGGGRSIPYVQEKLATLYEKTGVTPAEAAFRALTEDPQLLKELNDPKPFPPEAPVPTRYQPLADAEAVKLAVPELTPKQMAQAKELYDNPFKQWSQEAGEPAVYGRVNMDKLSLDTPTKGLVEAVAQIIDKAESTVTGKPAAVPWEIQRTLASQKFAQTLGIAMSDLPPTRLIDAREITIELRARHAVMEAMAAKAVNAAKAVRALGETVTDGQLLDMYRAQDNLVRAYNEFRGLSAEAARATQAGADMHAIGLTPKQIAALVDKLGRTNQRDVAQVLAEAADPAAAVRVSRAVVRTPFKTAIEIWKASILSGITTFEANLLGWAGMLAEPLDRAVMVPVGKAFAAYHKAQAKAKGEVYVPEPQVQGAEVGGTISGALKGWSDGLKMAGSVIRSQRHERMELMNREARRLAALKAHEEGLEIGSPEHTTRASELLTTPDAKIMEGLEKYATKLRRQEEKLEHAPPAEPGTPLSYAQIPFRILNATDAIARAMAENSERYSLAIRDAINEGFAAGTKEFQNRVNEIALDPTPQRAAEIKAAGDFYTYTTKLGKAGQHIQGLVDAVPVLQFILPFIRVPINLAKFSAGYMPGVNLLSSKARADLRGENGAIARDRVVARMMIGSVVATTVMGAVASGVMTGGGYGLDKGGKAARLAAGTWQPYSIKIGGTWYSYARIQPVAAVLSLAADVMELGEEFSEGKRDIGMLGAVVAAIGNATISQTYLLGLSNAVNAITDPNRYADRWFDQYAGSLVPAGGLLGQIAAGMDPHAREINSMLEAMQARIPIWREELLPVRNPLTGQPTLPEKAWPLAPIKATTPSEDKVLLWAAKLDIRIASAPKSIHVGKGSGKLGKVDIDDEHRNEYVRVQGETAHEALKNIVERPGWEKIPDIKKRDIYARVLQKARQRAAMVALPPEVRRIEARRIAEEVRAEYAKTPGVLDGGPFDQGIVRQE